jgi:hypothetical protein
VLGIEFGVGGDDYDEHRHADNSAADNTAAHHRARRDFDDDSSPLG